MKNQKIIAIHKTEKKQVALTGFLTMPLHVGERAWIHHGSQTISTSPVKQILEVSADGVVFETMNTIYSLIYTFIPIETEVMCA